MNYFDMMSELSKDYVVWLKSPGPTSFWQCTVVDGRNTVAKEQGDNPQQAIRKAYLQIFPIPKNKLTGKMSQND